MDIRSHNHELKDTRIRKPEHRTETNEKSVRDVPGHCGTLERKELGHHDERIWEHKRELGGSETSFQGMSPEQAKRLYLDKAGQLERQARELKSKANHFERTINETEDHSAKEALRKRINDLRQESRKLEQEAQGLKRKFEQAIQSDVSFRGGLGCSNIAGIRASGLKNDAANLDMRASHLNSEAMRETSPGRAAVMRSEASRCKNEAEIKRREAKRIETRLKEEKAQEQKKQEQKKKKK